MRNTRRTVRKFQEQQHFLEHEVLSDRSNVTEKAAWTESSNQSYKEIGIDNVNRLHPPSTPDSDEDDVDALRIVPGRGQPQPHKTKLGWWDQLGREWTAVKFLGRYDLSAVFRSKLWSPADVRIFQCTTEERLFPPSNPEKDWWQIQYLGSWR